MNGELYYERLNSTPELYREAHLKKGALKTENTKQKGRGRVAKPKAPMLKLRPTKKIGHSKKAKQGKLKTSTKTKKREL